jgi:hypothetical protein
MDVVLAEVLIMSEQEVLKIVRDNTLIHGSLQISVGVP